MGVKMGNPSSGNANTAEHGIFTVGHPPSTIQKTEIFCFSNLNEF
jgi:hypothetical protein